ncbi:ASST-domain-containing protein [Dactylonectria macrodidyma]|uniref:ASST-domain-containing protein n=1 Tax=Dactylonectria macrodidyma TaxID=307937 RepID=A0A9P9E416_9HYPO|nr:ASST-domain-containing protein [Dactylonectria macrodidyma]
MADVPLHTDYASYQNGSLGEKPIQSFHSAPLVKAPIYQVNKLEHVDSNESAYLFMTGSYGERFGPSIVSAKDLSLIWADEHYFFSQAAEGNWFKDQWVLSVFVDQGVRIFNQHYQPLYYVRPQGELAGRNGDSHEAHLTKDDTVVLIVCPEVNVDLTSLGGLKSDPILNCHIQEIEPVENKVLFQWATLDYFDISDSYWKYKGTGVYNLGTKAFDFCHMNSVEKTPNGDFMISHRHFSTITLVDGKTKEVKWVMGGKRNQFTDISEGGKSAAFAFQHQPRLTGENRIILFDNAGLDNGFCLNRTCSRGLELEFDPVKKTVWVVNEWYHPQKIMSISRGGAQRLSNGNTVIAWGQNPMFTEHTPDGEIVLDFQRGRVIHHDHGFPAVIAYRTFMGPWEGKPSWGPNISAAAEVEGGPKKIFVSWNGATNVDQWVLLQSNNISQLSGADNVVAQSHRLGFETPFDIMYNTSFARVAAMDADGNIIGSTPAVEIRTGRLQKLDYDVVGVGFNDPDAFDSDSLDATVPEVSVNEGSTSADVAYATTPGPTEWSNDVTTTYSAVAAHYPTSTQLLPPSAYSIPQLVNISDYSSTSFYVGAGFVFTLAL